MGAWTCCLSSGVYSSANFIVFLRVETTQFLIEKCITFVRIELKAIEISYFFEIGRNRKFIRSNMLQLKMLCVVILMLAESHF